MLEKKICCVVAVLSEFRMEGFCVRCCFCCCYRRRRRLRCSSSRLFSTSLFLLSLVQFLDFIFTRLRYFIEIFMHFNDDQSTARLSTNLQWNETLEWLWKKPKNQKNKEFSLGLYSSSFRFVVHKWKKRRRTIWCGGKKIWRPIEICSYIRIHFSILRIENGIERDRNVTSDFNVSAFSMKLQLLAVDIYFWLEVDYRMIYLIIWFVEIIGKFETNFISHSKWQKIFSNIFFSHLFQNNIQIRG